MWHICENVVTVSVAMIWSGLLWMMYSCLSVVGEQWGNTIQQVYCITSLLKYAGFRRGIHDIMR